MKKARLKTEKNKKEKQIDSKFSTSSIVITTLLMVALLLGSYFLTIKIIDKQEKEEESEKIDVRKNNTINYSDVDDIKEDSYYLLFDKDDDELNSTYDSYINSLKYSSYDKEFYYIDLSADENKDLLSDKESLKDLKDIKVKDTTLVYVEDGKIKETYVGSKDVSNYLLSFFITTSENSNSNETSNLESNSNKKKKKESNSNK